MVKNPPSMQDTWAWTLGWEDPLEEGMATTPVFLPGESPWSEKPGRLQSMGSQRVRHDWATKHTYTCSLILWIQRYIFGEWRLKFMLLHAEFMCLTTMLCYWLNSKEDSSLTGWRQMFLRKSRALQIRILKRGHTLF